MNRFVRLAVAAAGIVGPAIALGAAPAAAQAPPSNPEVNVFEIEAKTNYCQGGGTTCATAAGDLSKLRFADVTVWRFSPVNSGDSESSGNQEGNQTNKRGRVTGKPELLNIKCAWHHYIAANGHLHAFSIGLLGATAGAGLPFPPVTLDDASAMVASGGETSKRAVGRLDIEASDGQGTTAEVHGTQVTNNAAIPFPTRTSGGFQIHLKGTVMDEDITAGPAGKPRAVGPGETSCRTNVKSVILKGAPPPDFESEVHDNGDPS